MNIHTHVAFSIYVVLEKTYVTFW